MILYDQIKEKYKAKGYTFREYKMALNLHATRSKESQSNKFDDLGGIAWIDENGEKQAFNFWCTTDPGKYWLQNPMKEDGTAILIPNQYLECYAAGKHKGQYEAFVQVKPMQYVRDNNKDTLLNFDLYRDPIKRKYHMFWDNIGSNFHRASEFKIVQWVEQYSAACQVVQRPETFKKLIELRDKSVLHGFKRFDYTLFEDL